MTTDSTTMARVRAAAASLLLAATLAVGLGAGTAAADDVDGIAASPAASGAADQTRSRYSYQVEPGQQISDEYYVQNSGTTAQSVTVYATDAFNSDDGSFALLNGDQAPSDAGSWVTFDGGASQVTIDLAPAESRVIPFTVTTPADASPGDHAGGIIVSAISESGEISLDRRVAVRLYMRVKGDLQPNLSVGSVAASYTPNINPFAGEVSVTLTVRNAGNVALGADTIANVRGLFGLPLSGDVNVEIPEMLPGTTRTVTMTVPGVGPWVLLSPHVSLTPKIDQGAINPGPLLRVERDTSLFVVPWVLFVLILLIAAVVVVMRLRRRANDRRAAAWLEYTEAEARRKAREDEERAAADLAAAPVAKKTRAAKKPAAVDSDGDAHEQA